MTSKDLWNEYQFYTGTLTEHCRNLGFAGVAICWLFKHEDLTFPSLIYVSLFFFVGFFAADILHYFTGAMVLKFYNEHKERKMFEATGKIDGEFEKARWVDWPAFVFLVGKIILLTMGFAFVGIYILTKLACRLLN